jgi:hypothetical protein
VGNIPDSPSWRVDMRCDGRSFHSEGDVDFPQLNGPQHQTSNAVQRLFEIFESFGALPPKA